MRRLLQGTSAGILLAMTAASSTLAGPDVIEPQLFAGPDAGPIPLSAYYGIEPFPGAPMNTISGILDLPSGDREDMYAIHINNPAAFSARTTTTVFRGGQSDFDSVLWLFDSAGNPLLANDNRAPGDFGSLISSPATDGTGQVIPGPGTYFIAISGAGREPISAAGPQFFFGLPLEISGPDGIGGGAPIIGWTGDGPGGLYRIDLTGASFVAPAPGASALLLLSGLISTRRRR